MGRVGLFERASFIGTEQARLSDQLYVLLGLILPVEGLGVKAHNGIAWRDGAFPAQPLPFGDVRHAVTIYLGKLEVCRPAQHEQRELGWSRAYLGVRPDYTHHKTR